MKTNIKTQSLIPYLYIIRALQEKKKDAWIYPRKEYFKKLLGKGVVVNSTMNKEHWGPLMDNPNVDLEDVKRAVESYVIGTVEWDDTDFELADPGESHPNDKSPLGNLAFYYLVECCRKGAIPMKKLFTLSRGFGDTIEHGGQLPISVGFKNLMDSIRDGEMTQEHYLQNRKNLVVMEHRIPVKVIATQVLECHSVRDVYMHARTLKDNFCLLTKDEDDLLSQYKDSLPEGDLDRYDTTGIEIIGKADIAYRHNPMSAMKRELHWQVNH